ncbi:unnamed protein product [Calypogeia fissa]
MSTLHFALFNELIPKWSFRAPTSSCLSHRRKAPRGGFGVCSCRPNLLQQHARRSILLTFGIVGSQLSRVNSVGAIARNNMAEESRKKAEESQPGNFRYIQLWVSADGESHITECKMSGFRTEIYSSMPQFVRDEFGGQPEKVVFTELSVGLEQPLHTAPQVQFVVTLSGSWYIKTTDGEKYVFKPGEVLFQDNTKTTPAQKLGQHYSGAVGDVPCQQMIVQFNRPPEVDNTNPF